MPQQIRPIPLQMLYRLGTVNCYLVETDSGHILIDSGSSNQRKALERELENAGCRRGTLKLIVITHGDFDHTSNAAYLRRMLGAPIAMHRDDSGMAERGDMFWNRKNGNVVLRAIAPILFRFSRSNRFSPDFCLEDGSDLSAYGYSAQVLHLPGHSQGSIGILSAGGDLFCGDLLDNVKGPALNSIMDDLPAAHASLEKLRRFEIHTVYPGHGNPFSMGAMPAESRE